MADGVLLTSNFSNTTGFAWKFFRRLQNAIARDFHQRGYGIHLSFGRIEGPVTTVDPDIPVGSCEFDLLLHDAQSRRRFVSYLRTNRIKHVYITDFSSWSPLFAHMRTAGVKNIVVHDHSSSKSPLPASPEIGLKAIAKSLVHRTRILSADHVYACSDFVRQRLVAKACYPQDRISLVPHGIDVERFGSDSLDVPGTSVHVVMIGRAVFEKGGGVLLDALAMLRSMTEKPFRLTYGGAGPNLGDLQTRANTLGLGHLVNFVGEVQHTDRLLATADIAVVPSTWGDAAPLSVLEAMASSRPLIATAVGGIPEQVSESGAALLIPPGDPAALAEALLRLVEQPVLRKEMGQRGRVHVERHFSEPRFHRDVLALLVRDFGLNRRP